MSAPFDQGSPMRIELARVSIISKLKTLGSKTGLPGLCPQPQGGSWAPGSPLRPKEARPQEAWRAQYEFSQPVQTPLNINSRTEREM